MPAGIYSRCKVARKEALLLQVRIIIIIIIIIFITFILIIEIIIIIIINLFLLWGWSSSSEWSLGWAKTHLADAQTQVDEHGTTWKKIISHTKYCPDHSIYSDGDGYAELVICHECCPNYHLYLFHYQYNIHGQDVNYMVSIFRPACSKSCCIHISLHRP